MSAAAIAARPPAPRRAALARIVLAAAIAAAGAATIVLLAGGGRAAGLPAADGRWVTLPPSPLVRSEHSAARIGDHIYVVGGFKEGFAVTTGEGARYEISTGEWELLPPMPVAVNHPGVIAHRGKLWVHGGYQGAVCCETDALQRYDPKTGRWALLTPSGFARAAATLAVLGDRIYSIGGVRDLVSLSMVQAYDPETKRWSDQPDMRVERDHLASSVISTKKGPRVYVVGGRAGGFDTDAVESYSPRTRKWKREPSLLVPRSGFMTAAVKGRVIAVGGEQVSPGGGIVKEVEIYRPDRRRWKRLPDMLTPRHGHGVVSKGRMVFAIEGGPLRGGSFSSTHEAIRLTRRQLGLP